MVAQLDDSGNVVRRVGPADGVREHNLRLHRKRRPSHQDRGSLLRRTVLEPLEVTLRSDPAPSDSCRRGDPVTPLADARGTFVGVGAQTHCVAQPHDDLQRVPRWRLPRIRFLPGAQPLPANPTPDGGPDPNPMPDPNPNPDPPCKCSQ